LSASKTRAGEEAARPSRLWWLYFGYLVLAGLAGAAPYLSSIRESNLSGPSLGLPLLATVLNLWGMVGLWGYIRSRRLGWSGLWQICLGLTVIQMIYAGSLFLRFLPSSLAEPGAWVSLLGLAGLALGIPLLVALWRYAFVSPRIWGARAAH
jgi:hypothetical protein